MRRNKIFSIIDLKIKIQTCVKCLCCGVRICGRAVFFSCLIWGFFFLAGNKVLSFCHNGDPVWIDAWKILLFKFKALGRGLEACLSICVKQYILMGQNNCQLWLLSPCFLSICRRISMAGLSSRTVPHLADAIHAAVTSFAWFCCWQHFSNGTVRPSHFNGLVPFTILL